MNGYAGVFVHLWEMGRIRFPTRSNARGLWGSRGAEGERHPGAIREPGQWLARCFGRTSSSALRSLSCSVVFSTNRAASRMALDVHALLSDLGRDLFEPLQDLTLRVERPFRAARSQIVV